MKIKTTLILFILAVVACKQPVVEDDNEIKAKVSAEITGLSSGILKDELTLSAKTLYLNRNIVTSPIPAYITAVYIKLGESVKEGQKLFELETKEQRALGDQSLGIDTATLTFGKIIVNAQSSGIISTLDKQQVGDYLLEGAQLCIIAESNSLAFAVNVPYEYNDLAKSGTKCTLILPGNSTYYGRFTTPLTSVNSSSQTQTFLAKTYSNLFLPENLIVKVLVNKGPEIKDQILPKTAVLSDEMMENYWVMKLLNDSTAVKVDITPGIMGQDSVEIIEPKFNENDRFLISGNYGLPDTALIQVVPSSGK